MSETVRVHRAGKRTGGIEAIRATASFSNFIRYQTVRDLKMRYTRSLLGWSWSVINPITSLLIYTLVFGTILNGDRNMPPNPDGLDSFAHFLFSAQLMFSLFQAGSSQTMTSFQQVVQLRKRLYFPPASLAVAKTCGLLVDTGIEMIVLIIFYLIPGAVSITFISLIPLVLLMALFAMGVGLFLAVPNVRFADVGYLYQVVLRLLFFITPIIYSIQSVPEDFHGIPLRRIVELSPLTMFVTASRRVTYEQRWITPEIWLKLIIITAITASFGWWMFHRSADDAAEGE